MLRKCWQGGFDHENHTPSRQSRRAFVMPRVAHRPRGRTRAETCDGRHHNGRHPISVVADARAEGEGRHHVHRCQSIRLALRAAPWRAQGAPVEGNDAGAASGRTKAARHRAQRKRHEAERADHERSRARTSGRRSEARDEPRSRAVLLHCVRHAGRQGGLGVARRRTPSLPEFHDCQRDAHVVDTRFLRCEPGRSDVGTASGIASPVG